MAWRRRSVSQGVEIMAFMLIVDDERTRQLRDSKERLGVLFEQASDPYFLGSLKGTFIDINKAAEKLTGYSRAELIGKSFLKLKLLSPKQIAKASTLIARNALGKDTGPDEFILTRKDGKQVPVEIRTHPVKIHGKWGGLSLARDITERRQAKEALRERLKELGCLYAISELIEKPDISLEEILQGAVDLIPTAWQYPEIACARIIVDGKEFETENFGETIWKQASNILLHGERIGTIEVCYLEERDERDEGPFLKEERSLLNIVTKRLGHIVEHKRTEKRIERLTQVLRAIRNVNQLIVREKDRDKLLKGACDNLVETRGYSNAWITLLDESGKLVTHVESGLGKDFLPMVKRLKRGQLLACMQRALKQSEPMVTEDPASTCTDCPLSANYAGRSAATVRLEYKGKTYGLLSVSVPGETATDVEELGLFHEVATDIAFALHDIELEEQRKQVEEALGESEERLSQIIQGSSIVTFVIDNNHVITHWNKASENLTGIPADEVIGTKKQWTAFYPKERPVMADLIVDNVPEEEIVKYYGAKSQKSVLIDAAYEVEDFFPHLDKRGKWLFFAAAPLRDIKGKVIGAIETLQDITERKQAEEAVQKSLDDTIQAIGQTTQMRDPYTAAHQQRVTQLACAIAKEMSLPQDQIKGIRVAGLFHDIGKISIPAEILSKPSELLKTEHELIKAHSQAAYDILKTIEFPWPIANIVLQHHERINGSGYPNELKGDEILLEARIIAVADVVEAMSSHRPYRPALGIDKALEEIEKNKGTLYDPEVVDACLRLLSEGRFEFDA